MPSNPSSPICCPTSKAFPHRPKNKLRVRSYPPIDSGDVGQFIWRNNSSTYRRKVKKAVEFVQTYRLKTTGSTYLDRADKDAIHHLLDTMTFDPTRRVRNESNAREILTDTPKAA